MTPRTTDELRRLATPEFSRLLAADPGLAALERARYDRQAEAALLLEVMHLGELRIGHLPVLPISAAKWAFLWLLDSPYVVGGPVTGTDLAVALYVLACPDLRSLGVALPEIPALAAPYAAATGLPFAAAHAEVLALRATAFRPLELLEADAAPGAEEPRFDAAWLTRVVSIAARESGMAWELVMHEMSLSCCCALYVHFRSRECGATVRRRPDAKLAARISARINELEEAFLGRG